MYQIHFPVQPSVQPWLQRIDLQYAFYLPVLSLCANTAVAYLVELFPYRSRAKGIAIFQWWGRAAGFFNQFVNPIGIANAGAFM